MVDSVSYPSQPTSIVREEQARGQEWGFGLATEPPSKASQQANLRPSRAARRIAAIGRDERGLGRF
jgi:hypothetical protein